MRCGSVRCGALRCGDPRTDRFCYRPWNRAIVRGGEAPKKRPRRRPRIQDTPRLGAIDIGPRSSCEAPPHNPSNHVRPSPSVWRLRGLVPDEYSFGPSASYDLVFLDAGSPIRRQTDRHTHTRAPRCSLRQPAEQPPPLRESTSSTLRVPDYVKRAMPGRIRPTGLCNNPSNNPLARVSGPRPGLRLPRLLFAPPTSDHP